VFAALAGEAAPEVVVGGAGLDGGAAADAEFADEPGVVAGGAEQERVGLGPSGGRQGALKVAHAVAAQVLAGKDGSAADGADRGGDEVVLEKSAARGEGVEMRGLQGGVADAAEGVPALIVGEDEEEVGSIRRGRGRRRRLRADGGYSCEGEDKEV
jgi:hypothetical protein